MINKMIRNTNRRRLIRFYLNKKLDNKKLHSQTENMYKLKIQSLSLDDNNKKP